MERVSAQFSALAKNSRPDYKTRLISSPGKRSEKDRKFHLTRNERFRLG